MDQRKDFRTGNEKRGDGQMMDILVLIVLALLTGFVGFGVFILNELICDIKEIRWMLGLTDLKGELDDYE